jgi:hypothetical protein
VKPNKEITLVEALNQLNSIRSELLDLEQDEHERGPNSQDEFIQSDLVDRIDEARILIDEMLSEGTK